MSKMTAIAIFDHFDNPTEATEHHHAMNYRGVWRRLLKGNEDKHFKTLPYEDRLITDTCAYRKNRDYINNSIERLMDYKFAAVSSQNRQASTAANATGFDWAEDMEDAIEMRENNVDGWEDRFACGMKIDESKETAPTAPEEVEKKVSWTARCAAGQDEMADENEDQDETTRFVDVLFGTNHKTTDDIADENCVQTRRARDKSDDDNPDETEELGVYENHKEDDDQETDNEDDETSDEDTMEMPPSTDGEPGSADTTVELQDLKVSKTVDCPDLPLDADGQITLHYDGASARSPFNPHLPAEQGSFRDRSERSKLNAPKFVQAFLEAARSELEDSPEFKKRFRLPLSEKRWIGRAEKNHMDELEKAHDLVDAAKRLKGMNHSIVEQTTPLHQVMLMEDWMAEDQAGSSNA